MTDTFHLNDLNDIKIPTMNRMDHDNSDYTTHTDTDSSTTHSKTAATMLQLNQGREMRRNRQFIVQKNHTSGNDSSSSSVIGSPANSSYLNNQAVVEVINISNDIERETHCHITDQMVKQCIRNQIWINNKFLTNQTIQNMTITERNNPNTIINLLLTYTRKINYSDAHRFRFWRKYGVTVQKELNNIKSVCTRSIKNQIMRGKCTF